VHAVHLRTPHLGRVTLLAALLTLCVIALLALTADTGSDDVSGSSPPRSAELATTPQPAPTRVAEPVWVTDPLAPPALLR
jgi:hypothetical protein